MKISRKKKLVLTGVCILVLALIAVHIPRYNTTLWIGSDSGYQRLAGMDIIDSLASDPVLDIKVEIGGKIVYQTDSVDFNRYIYTRKDIPLRAGFHKIKISSESMNLNVEKIRYTLFDHYIVIELFPPSPEKDRRRVRVITGFMPFQFM